MWRLKRSNTPEIYQREREKERIIGERESEERTVRKKEKGCQIESQRERDRVWRERERSVRDR